MYHIYQWNDEQELKRINTYQYWNNEEIETKKAWDIRDGNFQKLEKYISSTGLNKDLIKALRYSGLSEKRGITGIELGGGVCWSAPIIFREYQHIEEMQFLEFSYHRIAKIAPLILEHYDIPEDKVKLIQGSFYEVKCPDECMDFVLLSQALHHADDIERLLAETYRILKKDGIVIIIGEHKMSNKAIFERMCGIAKDVISGDRNSDRCLLYRQAGCLGYDKVLGDRYYSLWSYAILFRKFNFECKRIRTSKEDHYGFILYKR